MKLFALGLLAAIVASGSADHGGNHTGGNHTAHDVRAPPQVHAALDAPNVASLDASGSGESVAEVTETSVPPAAVYMRAPPTTNKTTPGADV